MRCMCFYSIVHLVSTPQHLGGVGGDFLFLRLVRYYMLNNAMLAREILERPSFCISSHP